MDPEPHIPRIPDHEMIRVIGRGSYGDVWLARNVMGVLRAVKVVHRRRFDSERPYEREFRGLQAYEPLSRTSDGLVQVLHIGRHDAEGCFYCVMELADDANDSTEVFTRASAGGPGAVARDPAGYEPRTLRSDLARLTRLPVAECAETGRSLATGLAQLHRHRLVHRDLKPSNVIFVDGRAKLADIGLVAGLDESRSYVGTEGFVPPEGPGRPTADLFALGRLLYQAATGLGPERFPEIPPDWMDAPDTKALIEFHEILLKLGEGDVRRRYQDAAEVLADLALVQSGKSVVELRRLQRRLVWFRRFGAAAATGLAVAVAAWSWTAREARRERENSARIAEAERRARHQLVDTYLAQAGAERLVGRLDGRDTVLRVLTDATAYGPDAGQRRDLRSAAAAALAQTGTRWIPAPTGLRSLDPMSVAGDRRQELFARHDTTGALVALRIADGAVAASLPALRPVEDEVAGFSPDKRFVRLRRGREFIIGDFARGGYCRTNGACAFAPDNRLWAAAPDGAIELVDLSEDRVVRRLGRSAASGAGAPATHIAVSQDEAWIATATGDARIRLQATATDEDAGGSLEAPGAVYSLAWGPKPGQFAAGLESGEVIVWELPDTHPRRQFVARSGAVRRVAFDSTGKVLATAGEDEVVTLSDAGNGREIAVVPAIAWQLDFRPADGRLGLVWRGGEPGFIGRVEPVAFRILRDRSSTSGGDGALAFSADGRWLASGTSVGIEIIDAASGRSVATLPTRGTRALAFGPADASLRWLDGDEACSVTLEDGRPLEASLRREPGRPWTHLAVAERSGTVVLADGAAEALVVRAAGRDDIRLGPHQFVRFAAIRADGGLVASGSLTVPDVLVWDPATGRRVAQVPSGLAVHPVFSTDGRWLATSGPACSLWRTDGWQPGPELPTGPANTVAGAAAFSPDSRTLAAVYGDHEIRLFRLPEGAPGLTLEAPGSRRLLSLAFSPDGRVLAATTVQGEILSWCLPELDAELSRLGLRE